MVNEDYNIHRLSTSILKSSIMFASCIIYPRVLFFPQGSPAPWDAGQAINYVVGEL